MSAVFAEWWRGRAIRAERDADDLGGLLTNLLDSWGPSIGEWFPGREALSDWVANHRSRRSDGVEGSGYWAERAGVAEQDADRLALVLQAIDEHHNLGYVRSSGLRMALRDWMVNREKRYGSLPTGHTLEGSLKSGGWEM